MNVQVFDISLGGLVRVGDQQSLDGASGCANALLRSISSFQVDHVRIEVFRISILFVSIHLNSGSVYFDK